MIPKPIDVAKIREGDALMREARRLDPHVRLPSLLDLERMLPVPKTKDQTTGRPRGAEPTVTIALRIPQSMCNKLDAYVQALEEQTGLKATRTEICRHALRLYLEEQPTPAAKATAPKRTRRPARP